MAKQKGGLHKQVDSIFGGYANEQTKQNPPDSDQNYNSEAAEKKSSFPGNIAVSVSQSEEKKPSPQTQNEDINENIQTNPTQPEIKKQTEIDQSPQPDKPAKTEQAQSQKQAKKVMLPASLTSKPKIGLIDNLKVKMEEYAEENGKRQLYSLVAIPVLAIVLVFFLWQNLFSYSPASSKNTTKTTETEVSESVSVAKAGINWPKPELFPETFRDPMRKASQVVQKTNPANFPISGIVYMEEEPEKSSALIGKMTVFIGDQINGATVVNIEQNYVEFEIDGEVIRQGVGGD